MNSIARTSDPEFVREVYESDVPVLVDFGAEWCGPCKMLEPILHRMESEYAGRLKVVTIDVDEQRDLADHFGISPIPTLMLFENGELMAMEVGLLSEMQLKRWIESTVTLPAAVQEEAPAEEGSSEADADDEATATDA